MTKHKKIVSLPVYLTNLNDDAAAAKLFLVTERAVAGWRRQERIPVPITALWMVHIAGGELSLESIYGTFSRSLLTNRNVPRRARKKKAVLRGNV